MAERLLMFPIAHDLCTACGRPRRTHRVNGLWVGCTRDIAIGRDVVAADRRLRLALLQARALNIRRCGADDARDR